MSLINALTVELTVSSEKSFQGGLRAARRSVRLLNLLGRSTQVIFHRFNSRLTMIGKALGLYMDVGKEQLSYLR